MFRLRMLHRTGTSGDLHRASGTLEAFGEPSETFGGPSRNRRGSSGGLQELSRSFRDLRGPSANIRKPPLATSGEPSADDIGTKCYISILIPRRKLSSGAIAYHKPVCGVKLLEIRRSPFHCFTNAEPIQRESLRHAVSGRLAV